MSDRKRGQRLGRRLAVAMVTCAAVSLVGVPPASAAPVQATKLSADLDPDAEFGRAVAVSGTTALIGAPQDDTPAHTAGSAAVFVRNGDTWSQQARLVASPSRPGDYFGTSVALDGDTAVVGAPRDDFGDQFPDAGSAYVFTRSGATWTLQARLTPPRPWKDGLFGWSVAVQGNTAVIGAPRYRGEVVSGLTFVFTRSGATWSQRAVLVPSDARYDDLFGLAVAIDRGSIIVGASGHATASGGDAGAAYVFVHTAAGWIEQAELTVVLRGSPIERFGTAVDISADTVVVGAISGNARHIAFTGAAYVFTRSGGVWAQEAKLVAKHPHEFDYFGCAVAVQSGVAVVGAEARTAESTEGAAYVFHRRGTSWIQREPLVPMATLDPILFGAAVALDGSTLLVGAPLDQSGTVYAYWT